LRKTTAQEQRTYQKNGKHDKRKHTTKRTSGKHIKDEPEKEEWESFNKNRGLKCYIWAEIKNLQLNL
jgi:hypothetical protein